MLANPAATPIGPGRIKLVQVLDGDGPPPRPEGQAWGELGVCEICLHVARRRRRCTSGSSPAGATSLMEPLDGCGDAERRRRSTSRYVADPWGGKLEMIEWTGLWQSLPGRAAGRGREPRRLRRRGHRARAARSTSGSGFTELLFESTEFFDPMAPWYDRASCRRST